MLLLQQRGREAESEPVGTILSTRIGVPGNAEVAGPGTGRVGLAGPGTTWICPNPSAPRTSRRPPPRERPEVPVRHPPGRSVRAAGLPNLAPKDFKGNRGGYPVPHAAPFPRPRP